jgi:hypothetical protein
VILARGISGKWSDMSAVRYLEEEIVIKKAIEALIKELGPVEAMRFVNMPRKKRLESVRRHREWQKTLNKEQYFKEVIKK